MNWIGKFGISLNNDSQKIKRYKRNISTQTSYEKLDIIRRSQMPKLLNRNHGISPIGAVAKMLKKSIMNDKNQTIETSFVILLFLRIFFRWQSTIKKIRSFINKKKEIRQKKRIKLNSMEDFQGFVLRGFKNNPQIENVIFLNYFIYDQSLQLNLVNVT